MGATSRSHSSITDTATTITAKPPRRRDERGRHTRARGKIAAITNVQPSRWCRNAERAKNHGFCSCTRNAVPAVTKASGQVSRQRGDVNRPRTSASSAPPASINTSAHDPCAYMWMAEFVKNAITGQSSTPRPNASVGQRYARQRRMRQTSCPTSASQSKHNPTNRIMAPNAQWIISARGCIRLLEVGEHRPRDEQREERTDDHDEERRLEDQPPEALTARGEQRDSVGLQDRPDQASGGRRRSEQRNRVHTECVVVDTNRGRVMSDRRFHAPLGPTIRARFSLHEPVRCWFNRSVSDESISPLREPPVRSVESRDGVVVLHLAGELDLYNANELRSALADALAQEPGRIVVEMSEVEFVDSTALGVLIEARSKLAPNGLLLAAPQPETRRTLQVSGLDRHLPVLDSLADAVDA